MQTKLTKLLGIRYPIMQGGMAWIADASLASAVSNAGGLGIISAMNANADWVREEIRKCRTMTDKPFGVNIMLMSPHVEEVAKMVAEEKVPVVTTGAGNPSALLKCGRRRASRSFPSWLPRRLPKWSSARAWTQSSRKAAKAAVTSAISPPWRSFRRSWMRSASPSWRRAALRTAGAWLRRFALGACGVQMGTRFLVATECTVSAEYKRKVLAAKDISTMVTGRRLGHPVRAIKTAYTNQYAKLEADSNYPDEKLEEYGVGSLRKAAKDGNASEGCFLAGQIAGMVNKEQPPQRSLKRS